MNLKQIEYFEAVCQAGSISAAAQQLYVSRSVISRELQMLEKELGISLLLRSRSGIELSEQGRMLRDLFLQFKGLFTTLQAQVLAVAGQEERHNINVGVAISCWNFFPLDMYERFQSENPQIKITAAELSSYDAIAKVCDGSVDVALTPIGIENAPPSLGVMNLCETYNVFCASPDSPLARNSSINYHDIHSLPIAVLNSKLPVDWQLQIRLRTDNLDLIHSSVAKGLLYTILPDGCVRDWTDVAVLPLNPKKSNTLRAIWNKDFQSSQELKQLLSFLKKNFRVK